MALTLEWPITLSAGWSGEHFHCCTLAYYVWGGSITPKRPHELVSQSQGENRGVDKTHRMTLCVVREFDSLPISFTVLIAVILPVCLAGMLPNFGDAPASKVDGEV